MPNTLSRRREKRTAEDKGGASAQRRAALCLLEPSDKVQFLHSVVALVLKHYPQAFGDVAMPAPRERMSEQEHAAFPKGRW